MIMGLSVLGLVACTIAVLVLAFNSFTSFQVLVGVMLIPGILGIFYLIGSLITDDS